MTKEAACTKFFWAGEGKHLPENKYWCSEVLSEESCIGFHINGHLHILKRPHQQYKTCSTVTQG